MSSASKPAQPFIVQQQAELRERLPFSDRQDFEDATRGLIARREPNAVTAADGRVVWDNDTYAFLDDDCPDTVNPSLWRQSRLVAEQGLFEVVEGIYQVRGLDLSNVTFVEGTTGVVVIDPLLSTETAAAALTLYREHRGDRPVTGVIYTHSHVDHFAGVKGVTTQEDVDASTVYRCSRRRASPGMRWPRTCTRAPPWPAGPPICTGRPWRVARRARSAPVSGRPPPPAPSA